MITHHGLIEEAKLCNVYDLWKKKPKGIGNDTDIIIIKVRTADKEISEMFFTRLKPNGTPELNVWDRASRIRRNRFAQFLRYNFNVKDLEKYNVRENIKNWTGEQVRLENDSIFIPQM